MSELHTTSVGDVSEAVNYCFAGIFFLGCSLILGSQMMLMIYFSHKLVIDKVESSGNDDNVQFP